MAKKLNWPTATVAVALIAALAATLILAPADVAREALATEGIVGVLVAAAMRSLRGGQ